MFDINLTYSGIESDMAHTSTFCVTNRFTAGEVTKTKHFDAWYKC